MGIIDSKENIFDILLSDIALENLITKGLDITYYSFSDTEISYDNIDLIDNEISTSKISIESSKLLNDTMLPELLTDNIPLQYSVHDKILNSDIRNGVFYVTGAILDSNSTLEHLDDLSNKFLIDINNDFKSKSNLFSFSEDFEDLEFKLSTGSIKFVTENQKPIIEENKNGRNINQINNFFNDIRLKNQIKFKKLEPILDLKKTNGIKKNLQNQTITTIEERINFEALKQKLNNLKNNGFSQKVYFDKTSLNNNIILQGFSFKNTNVENLIILDLGEYQNKRYLMFGKMKLKNNNLGNIPENMHYFNIFTLVFEK